MLPRSSPGHCVKKTVDRLGPQHVVEVSFVFVFAGLRPFRSAQTIAGLLDVG